MSNLQRVLIMAGGTGGHVFPGLAIAKRLQEEGIHVDWLGTRKGLEAKLVDQAGIALHFISISGIRGKGLSGILLAPGRVTIALIQAWRIIRRLKPDVVIGMGGFVSGPGGIASWLQKCPLIIHEQNAKPGTTNKWLSRIAKKILEGFPNTFATKLNVITVGNPLRKEMITLPPPMRHNKSLLVLGGSLGAAAINQLLPKALAHIPKEQRPEVYHQTGEKHFAETVAAYHAAGINAKIVPFIHEMDKAYRWADLVVSRSGALTVAELCAAGIGAILVPFPYAIDDHQTANANFMAASGAALLIQQSALTEEKLAAILQELIAAPTRCQDMAQAAYQLRKVDATEKIVSICKEMI